MENVDPEVGIQAEVSPGEVGVPVRFFVNVSDVEADQPQPGQNDGEEPIPGEPRVVWEMEDGTILYGSEVVHVFQRPGSKNVSVTFQDGDGGTAEGTLSYLVNPKSADINPAQAQVTRRDGTINTNPTVPLGEYSEEEVDDTVFYVREGQSIVIEVDVQSAQLFDGAYDAAIVSWAGVPEGADVEILPISPPVGSPNDGEVLQRARFVWTPNYYQAKSYPIRLNATGGITESSASQVFRINVLDGGSPMLAATTGSLRRGRVVFYEYEKDNDQLTFIPVREVEVGLGAYDVIADESRQQVFVSSPGSGHVAVLKNRPFEVVRRIPTGGSTLDLAWGGGYLWTVSAEEGTLMAIQPDTLKVVRRFTLPSLVYPVSVLWVGQDQGLGTDRVLVGCGRSGRLMILNAQNFLSGQEEGSIEHTIELGGSLTHLVAADGQLSISDGKTRTIYQGSLNTLVVSGSSDTFTYINEIPFFAQDMTTFQGYTWVSTGDALFQIDSEGSVDRFDVEAARILPVGFDYLEQDGLVITSSNRIDHYVLDQFNLTSILGTESSRIQRMSAFLSIFTDEEE